jgi:RimJ/RimL family protein N-acetyltransferase
MHSGPSTITTRRCMRHATAPSLAWSRKIGKWIIALADDRSNGSSAAIVLNEPRHILRDGTQVQIRQLVADDAALYPDFLSDVSAADLRLRFFASMREVNHELLGRLIHYDSNCAMAFVAVDGKTRKLLGVVRLHDDAEGYGAEFAVLVRSRLKGHGVGWLLMKRMLDFARHKRSLKTVWGQVLSENTSMLTMCAELGFLIADDPNDRGVRTVTLPVELVENLHQSDPGRSAAARL